MAASGVKSERGGRERGESRKLQGRKLGAEPGALWSAVASRASRTRLEPGPCGSGRREFDLLRRLVRRRRSSTLFRCLPISAGVSANARDRAARPERGQEEEQAGES